MTGILGTKAPWESDLNLLFHVAIFALVLLGFMHARRQKYDTHEKRMLTAIGLSAASLILWMLPSYIRTLDIITTGFFTDPGVMITNLHVVAGTITGVLAGYIVALMKFKIPKRFRTRNIQRVMRSTLAMWSVTVSLGFVFYFYYFFIRYPIR